MGFHKFPGIKKLEADMLKHIQEEGKMERRKVKMETKHVLFPLCLLSNQKEKQGISGRKRNKTFTLWNSPGQAHITGKL